MSGVLQDLRHAWRMLRSKPGLAIIAVLTLGLGIGANTAMFSVVDAVILRPLPYRSPDRLVMVKESVPKAIPQPIPVCAPDVVQFQRENQSFQSMAGFFGSELDLAGATEPERVTYDRINWNLFSVLGVHPAMGRSFTAAEDQPGHLVAILSYRLWQRRFGADPEILGKTVNLDRQPYAVVGILPRNFVFPLPGMNQGPAADVFVPMAFTKDELAAAGDNFNYSVIGRLKRGVTLAQANSDLQSIAHRIWETYPAQLRDQLDLQALALPLGQEVVGNIRTPLLLLLGAVGFVLLIGCMNVANLLLARATDRRKEIAVRLAMGASRLRLLRQLLAESMLLTLAAGGMGLAFAFWIVHSVLALLPSSIPRAHDIGLNLPVLGFALALAVVTGLIFAIIPALTFSRTNVNDGLKEGGRSGTEGVEHHRIRGALVISEIALSMVLLLGAGLLLRSLQHVLATDPGFQPEHVLTASISLPESQYKETSQVRNFYRQLVERLQHLPEVQMAGASTDLPLEAGWNHLFTPEGYQPPPGGSLNVCYHSVILGGYLQTMGVPLLRGRYFTDLDTSYSTKVLLVSESLARRYWPNQDPIGKRLKWGTASSDNPWLTIIGVVGDVKQGPLDVATTPHTYQPYSQLVPSKALNVALRASADPENLASLLRNTVWQLDPQLAVADVRTMDQVISESTAARRFNLFLIGGFAVLGLLLAATGIYAVIAYSVARREHEIGIRMALGAQRGDIMAMVIGQAAIFLGLGLAIGGLGAMALTRSLTSFLYGIRPSDPITFIAVVLILGAVALLASYLPARRATRIDPMDALRYE